MSWCNVCSFFRTNWRDCQKVFTRLFRTSFLRVAFTFNGMNKKKFIVFFCCSVAMIKILYCLFWRCCYCTFAPMLLPIFSSFSFHSRTTNRSRIYNFHLKLPIKYILLIWYALPNSTFTHSLSHIFKWISTEKKPTIAKKKWK